MTSSVRDSLAQVAGAAQGVGPEEPPEGAHLRVAAPEGSRERVAAMYRQYGPVIYRRCLRLLRDREEARDVTQEVFLKLLQESSRAGARAFSIRWVHRVTTNHCLNILRESGRTLRDPLERGLDHWTTPATAEPALAQLARVVLSRFDVATQTVAVAVFVDGMEYEEVAELLGVSARTISRKVDRFLRDARKFLHRVR